MCEPRDEDQRGTCSRSLRIVIVADDCMCSYYQRAYRRMGHEIVGVASNWREADEISRALCPDLLISYLPAYSPRSSPGCGLAPHTSSFPGDRGTPDTLNHYWEH
jgi:hypothetical protein